MTRRIGPRGLDARACRDGLAGHPFAGCKVTVWMGNYSAFNGYRFTPSDYSEVVCTACETRWRTKANYVSMLPDTSREA